MRKLNYTIHIIPDNEDRVKVFSLSTRTLRILISISILFLISLGIGIYYSLPKLLKYNQLVRDRDRLIEENLKINRILNDYNRIKQMEKYIRNLLGVDFGIEGEVDTSAIEQAVENSKEELLPLASLENIPSFPPVNGYVTQHFHIEDHDRSKKHYGIDIASKSGEPIYAAASGLVVFSDWTYRYGYMVIIYHGDEYFTVYAHNLRNTVQQHDWVDQGDLIGYLGNSGISYGPHLHFEIWKNGTPVDPLLYIPSYKKKDVSVEEEIKTD